MQVVPLDFVQLHLKKLSSSLAKKRYKSARTGIVYDPYFQVGCPGNHGMEGIHFELVLPQVFVHVASAHIRRRLATPRADRAHTSTSIVLEGTPSAIAEVTKPLSASSDRWLLRKTRGGARRVMLKYAMSKTQTTTMLQIDRSSYLRGRGVPIPLTCSCLNLNQTADLAGGGHFRLIGRATNEWLISRDAAPYATLMM
jgi:hypothetical protein